MLKRNTCLLTLAMAAAGLGIGCGDPPPAVDPSGEVVKTGDGKIVSAAAANAFKEGFAKLQKHDNANDWTDAECNATADHFKKANEEQQGTFFEALYNAGVAHQRCKHDDEAKKLFEEVLSKNSKFHRARVHVALYNYAKDKDVEKAIGEMKQAIADAEFKNEEALVNLAILQMARDGKSGDSGCDDDFSCAKLNLQRALAINDGFMPAFNQLAIYYLENAKKEAGVKKGKVKVASGKDKKANTQALELAALVVSQALRKNPNYAPVHNTSGLISAELDDLSAAAQAFGTARKLDAKFFEAHMNYAAVNLSFRGFAQAEQAYRAALTLRPNDFEAHLGLALAVRGQIGDSNFEKNVAEAEQLLEKARKLDPNRPETYYNEAILVEEFKARGGDFAKNEPVLLKAKSLFGEFTTKASGKEEYAEAVKRAKERMEEIDQKIKFAKQSEEDRKKMEEFMKQQAAREQLEQQNKEGN